MLSRSMLPRAVSDHGCILDRDDRVQLFSATRGEWAAGDDAALRMQRPLPRPT